MTEENKEIIFDMCYDYATYSDGSFSCIFYTRSDTSYQDMGDFSDDLFSHFIFIQFGTKPKGTRGQFRLRGLANSESWLFLLLRKGKLKQVGAKNNGKNVEE
jgi:hypothetical protein